MRRDAVTVFLGDADAPGTGIRSGMHTGLSEREAEVIRLITRGYTNLEIAESCYLSITTVKYHVRSAYRKIGVVRRAQAVKWGMDHGMELQRGPSVTHAGDHQEIMTPECEIQAASSSG